MGFKTVLAAAMLAAAASSPAVAGPILTDLTSADYITVDGLDWAWAGPISSGVWYGGNTLYQASLHEGWREATDLEWSKRPPSSAFGSKCASKYWNSYFTHCDFGDSVAQHWVAGPENYFDLWYVRSSNPSNEVPEPATPVLLGAAALSLLWARRKKTS